MDKSLPVFEEPTFTSPPMDAPSPPIITDEPLALPVQSVTSLPRATPTPPSFGKPLVHTAKEVPREFPQPQQARVTNNIQASVSPVIASGGSAGMVVDVAPVIALMSRVVHAGLYDQFNPNLLKEMNDTIAKLTNYLPVPKEGLRVVSQNLREVGQFPVLGPMDAKRTKRVKEDYTILFERIRPLQDAMRVLELDRRAHAPALVHPPLLYLIGGVFSMFVSIEQPYPTQLDHVVSGISRAIRELPPSPSRGQYGPLIASFIHFLRCVIVRVLEIRTPTANYEIVQLILAMSKATKSLLIDPSAGSTQLKILVENLKNVMVTIKSTMPSKVGKELTPAEESTLYKEAIEQFNQTIEGMARKPKEVPPRELELAKGIASQIPKLQSGFKEIHGLPYEKEKMKGGLGALGRGVLGDAQQLAMDVGEVARQAAARLGAHSEAQATQTTQATQAAQEEWRDAKLGALETFLLSGLMTELTVACIAVRNRLPHHSHVPILLVLLSIASQFALYPYV